MRKTFQLGGFVAGAVLIAFGIAAIVMGMNGRSTVNDNLKQEQIVGTPDMTPTGIKAAAQKAGLQNISFPTCRQLFPRRSARSFSFQGVVLCRLPLSQTAGRGAHHDLRRAGQPGPGRDGRPRG
jgi:hypothetical protein